jgi:hypothetical protein
MIFVTLLSAIRIDNTIDCIHQTIDCIFRSAEIIGLAAEVPICRALHLDG